MSDWPELTLVREEGSDSVEMLSPLKEAKRTRWEYEDYVPKIELVGVEAERDHLKALVEDLGGRP